MSRKKHRPRTNRSMACSRKTFCLNGFNIKRFAHPCRLHVLFLGMRCHWLKRHAERPERLDSRLQRRCKFSCVFWKERGFKSLISCKCKCRTPNELHLYIAEAKSFPLVYCANVSVQPLLHSSLLQWFPLG